MASVRGAGCGKNRCEGGGGGGIIARSVGVDIFTMGQYLQPTKKHLPVVEFVTPAKFKALGALAKTKGFHQVVSSPLSRSSYHAEQAFPT